MLSIVGDFKKFRSAQRDDRALQTCVRSELRAKRAMRMCPRSGQIFSNVNIKQDHYFGLKC